MAAIKSWTVSDTLWNRIASLIPRPKRTPGRKYKRRPGGGRKPIPPRTVFAGIVYVLRTGCQWKALPREYGSASSVHKYFLEWKGCGVFVKMWRRGLAEYDEMEGIAWSWQSIDGAMVKAPLAQEAVGPNPTDRGKKRYETQRARRRPWNPAVISRERSQSTRCEALGANVGFIGDTPPQRSGPASVCRQGLRGKTGPEDNEATSLHSACPPTRGRSDGKEAWSEASGQKMGRRTSPLMGESVSEAVGAL